MAEENKDAPKKVRRYNRLYLIAFAIVVLAALTTDVFGLCAPKMHPILSPSDEVRFLTVEEKADRLLAKMSLPAKVGQMIIAGIHGTEINDDSRYLLREYNFGGFILFDRNMQSKEQVKKLNGDLQKYAAESQTAARKIPLFIAIDEEGGVVARMTEHLKAPPAAEIVGQSGNPAEAARWAKITAEELRPIGFNLNFAPVADVGAPHGRSYSRDATETAKFVKAVVDSYAENGFLCTLKHFPGLGRGQTDSHVDSVTVNASREDLEKTDLLPFRQVISNCGNDKFFVMVSHLTYPALDAAPASLSAPIMTDLLRTKLGYKGIIITDDMEMGAVANHYSFGAAAVQAVKAGADIVLVCHEYAHEIEAYNAILKAAKDGEISESRINESVKRILCAKLRIK